MRIILRGTSRNWAEHMTWGMKKMKSWMIYMMTEKTIMAKRQKRYSSEAVDIPE